jgi:hypothetical protein
MMAGSKGDNKQKSQDSFADDLDSMLNLDESAEQEVGFIDDDDDAIDRLLVGDAFETNDNEDLMAETDDFDELLASEIDQDKELVSDVDEFGDEVDDLISNIQLNPKQDKAVDEEDMAPLDDLIAENAEVTELESVVAIDTVAEDDFTLPDLDVNSADNNDVLENMAEIDEFSDNPLPGVDDNANFLLADFDISADDGFKPDEFDTPTQEVSEPESSEFELVEEVASIAVESEANFTDSIVEDSEEELLVESILEQSSSKIPQPESQNIQPTENYAALIAGLTSQLHDLTKKHSHFANELRLKGDKEELGGVAESIESLQTEQKKTKRSIDALNSKKPISAYVANGVAVFALIVGGSLGYQGFVAKNQVDQLVEYMNKIQAQINEVPAANAADTEMLRNQLEELSRANSVASEQITALTKAVHVSGDAGSSAGQPSGDVAKQLADLTNQDMQMGALIESLQSKVVALEKAKPVAIAKPEKTEPKKPAPAPVQDDWVVNLVAFKQDWYAKRKAEEFASKGVPAQVVKSDSKGETWYRLSVDGFKSQYEAAAYAARVKKSLNLDSVWVNKNKN